MKPEIRLGIMPCGWTGWTAGKNVTTGLLKLVTSDELRPHIKTFLISDPTLELNLEEEDLKDVTFIHLPRKNRLEGLINSLSRLFFSYDKTVYQIIKEHDLNCFLAPLSMISHPTVPFLSWFSDFQYRYFPKMFRFRDRLEYALRFSLSTARSTLVLVFGPSVDQDFARYLPKYRSKSTISTLFVSIPSVARDRPSNWAREQYRLPDRYIFLPNQFWKHKNHQAVFEAIALLHTKGTDIQIVCTGQGRDHRNPKHFDSLKELLKNHGVEHLVRFLGLVPYDDVFSLMRESIAVINPSLFEGFSLTVREAILMGKNVILSDIPAHHEHGGESQLHFFNPKDHFQLAQVIEKVWKENKAQLVAMESLKQELIRRKEMSSNLLSIFQKAISLKVR